MIQSKHCELCEHENRTLKIGLTCGLTNKKPTFKKTCSNIKFSSPFKEYIHELLNQIEGVKEGKISVYLNFTLLCVIGLTIILGSRSLLEQIFEMEFGYSGWIYFQQTLLVYMVGTVFISLAFWRLNKYRKTLKKLESDRREIDIVLNNYKIDIATLSNRTKK